MGNHKRGHELYRQIGQLLQVTMNAAQMCEQFKSASQTVCH